MIENNYKNINITKTLADIEKQIDAESLQNNKTNHNDLILPITKDTGIFLNIILESINATRVLEIGTSIGYSTLWFAHALSQKKNNNSQTKKKQIITIENNPLKVERATNNFKEAGVLDMIEIHQDNALTILHKLSKDYDNTLKKETELFDFIFLDADKENLIKYFDLVLPMTRKGGFIVTDNILYPIEYKAIMSHFIDHLKKSKSIRSVTIPIGHGEELSLKIA